MAKRGLRGGLPHLVWRSIVPETRPREGYPRAAALSWARGMAVEIRRMASSFVEEHTAALDGPAAADAPMAETDDGAALDDMTHRADDFGDDDLLDDDAWWMADGGDLDALTEIETALVDDLPAGAGGDDQLLEYVDRVSALVTAMRRCLLEEGCASIEHARAALGDARRLVDEVTATQAAQESLERREEAEEWRKWVAEGIDQGARRAHAFSRAPEAWQPSEVINAMGMISADPTDLMEAQRAKYAGRWRAAGKGFEYRWDSCDELSALGADDIRAASLSFPRSTASAYEGFHVRHLALLCDDGLRVVATILRAVEVLGAWPRQVALITMPLLPKASGGYRAIGVLTALYRVWAKCRRPHADEWERRHSRGYFSAAAGNGPADTVWRQAARQEARVGTGEVAAAVIDDMEAFYELLSRDRLYSEADATGFPLAILRAALAAYAGPRMLTCAGRTARELYPVDGIVAGCSMATTLVKIYYLRPMDLFVASLPPSLHTDVHIDDVVISGEASAEALVDDISEARSRLLRMISEVLGGRVAQDKSSVIASSKAVARRIMDRIGLEGEVRASMVNLGVDFTAGAPRRRVMRASKRAIRWTKGLARRGRLVALRAAVGAKACRIFTGGVAPAVAYDAVVWGLDNAEVIRLRRLGAATLAPKARGRSLTAVHLINGTPTACTEQAAPIQLSRMIWKAATCKKDAEARGTDLGSISRWWDAAAPAFREAVEALAQLHGGGGGGMAGRVARRAWSAVRGPFGAAALSLARIGWKLVSAFEVVDDRGAQMFLTQTTPRLFRDLLVAGVRRSMERHLGAVRAAEHGQYAGRRVCFDLAAKAIREHKGMTRQQVGAFRSVLCSAVMTMDKAEKGGYDVINVCPCCGKKRDTVHHRVYECDVTKEAVAAAVPQWFVDEARRDAGGDLFFTTATFPHPADEAPRPPEQIRLEVERFGERAGAGGVGISGRLYMDGSATPSPIKDMERAGCAIIELNDEGEMTSRVTAAVPFHLPHTSQVAEHLCLVGAVRLLEGPADAASDCLGVVKAFAGGRDLMVAARRKYGGLLLDLLRDPSRLRLLRSLRWVKAHVTADGTESSDKLLDIKGNALADESAKDVVRNLAKPGVDLQAQIDFWVKRAPLVAKAVGVAMSMFPPAPGNMQRKQVPRDASSARELKLHHWEFREGAWRCSICASWARGGAVPARRKLERCGGGEAQAQAATAHATRGHSLRRAAGQVPFIYCEQCGGWSARRAHILRRECGPPTAAGKLALRRIREGLHPWRRKKQGGGEEPRGAVTTVACFNEADGTWTSLPSRGPVLLEEACGGGVLSGMADTTETGAQPLRSGPPCAPCPSGAAPVFGADADDAMRGEEVKAEEEDGQPGRVRPREREDEEDQGGSNDSRWQDGDDRATHDVGHQLAHPPHAKRPRRDRAEESPPNATAAEGRAAEIGDGRDPRLRGTSMHMLVARLSALPKRIVDDDVVSVFNAATRRIVSTPIRRAVREIEHLRAAGFRDSDQRGEDLTDGESQEGGGAPASGTDSGGGRADQGAAEVAIDVDTPTHEPQEPQHFSSRRALLEALRYGAGGGGGQLGAERVPALRRPAARPPLLARPCPALPPHRLIHGGHLRGAAGGDGHGARAAGRMPGVAAREVRRRVGGSAEQRWASAARDEVGRAGSDVVLKSIPGSDVGTVPCVDSRLINVASPSNERADDRAYGMADKDTAAGADGALCSPPVEILGRGTPLRGDGDAAGGASAAGGLSVAPQGTDVAYERGRPRGVDLFRAGEGEDDADGTSTMRHGGLAGPAARAACPSADASSGNSVCGRRVRRRLREKTAVGCGGSPHSGAAPSGSAQVDPHRARVGHDRRGEPAPICAADGAACSSAVGRADPGPHVSATARAAATSPWRPAREFDWPRGPQPRGDGAVPTLSEPAH